MERIIKEKQNNVRPKPDGKQAKSFSYILCFFSNPYTISTAIRIKFDVEVVLTLTFTLT